MPRGPPPTAARCRRPSACSPTTRDVRRPGPTNGTSSASSGQLALRRPHAARRRDRRGRDGQEPARGRGRRRGARRRRPGAARGLPRGRRRAVRAVRPGRSSTTPPSSSPPRSAAGPATRGEALARLVRRAGRRAAAVRGRSGPATSRPRAARRCVDGIRHWLVASASAAPLLLVLEDLHWSTATTRDVVRQLVPAGRPGTAAGRRHDP